MNPKLSLARLPAHHRARKPDALAISDQDESLTWEQLDQRTNRAARSLIANGVVLDDMVTIALPNGLDFIEACFACWKAGATPQPVSARLPKAEIESIIALAKSKVIIANDEIDIDWTTISYPELLSQSDNDSALPELVTSCWKAPTSGGSTGRPKLILATSAAWCEFETAAGWRIAEDDVAVMPGPLYHNAPFVTAVAAMTAGAHLVIMPRFDAEAVLTNVDRYAATWIYLVPTMMNRIWRLDEAIKAKYAVATLRTVWHLAAPCPAWLKEAWINWLGGDVIWELYAATEGMAGTVITGTEWLEHRGSVGRVFSGEIKILDDDGKPVAPGITGEIFMRPDEKRGETFRYVGAKIEPRDGWQSLGDMGHFDEEGFLFLADRRSDMILVGGSNVYPAEIEAVLEEHPDIGSCAVIGLPDDDMGALIHAIIETKSSLVEADMHDFVAERLVSYKKPRTYEFVDHPLRDNAGKVRRSQLREARMQQKA